MSFLPIIIILCFLALFMTSNIKSSNLLKESKDELTQSELRYNKAIQEKDSLIFYYDSLANTLKEERVKVIESFNILVHEKDNEIKKEFKKYYDNSNVTWVELDSLLTVLLSE